MYFATAAFLFAASPLLVNALPASSAKREVLTGLQSACLHDVSLSFDDGPHIYTTDLVNSLVSYGANTTLFVNGYNWGCIYSEASVATLRHAHESGVTIGAHTWNHYDITLGTAAQLGAQLDLLETALLKILGIKPALFRAPYGSTNPELIAYLNSRGYTVLGWNALTGDADGATVEAQFASLSTARVGDMFLAHDINQGTVEQVIPRAVPGLVARGIKLVTADQCLGIPAYQGVGAGYGTRDASWTCTGTPVPGEGF